MSTATDAGPSTTVSPHGMNTTSTSAPDAPSAPLASPLTPKSRPAYTHNHPSQPPTFSQLAPVQYIDQPAPRPFSGDDAIDAIALRATISSLQIQRQRAQEDIRALDKIKRDAVARPEEFKRQLIAGRISHAGAGDARTDPSTGRYRFPEGDVQEGQESEDEHEDEGGEPGKEVKEVPDSQATGSFPSLPAQQNIVRCPPINWAKYHIVGESLDRMHEHQQRRPDDGLGSGRMNGGRAARDAVIAAPYDPFVDRLQENGARTSDGRKDSAATDYSNQTRRTSKMSDR